MVIAYIRTSTEDQNISLEAQHSKIEAMAALRDLAVDEYITEQESAKTLDRPGMERLLTLVRAGKVTTVLIAKLDRLTRSVRDLSDLTALFTKHNVTLISVAEMLDMSTATGRMIVNLIGTISQWERETIGERTATALRHQKAQRKVYSAVPYGYVAIEGRLVAVEAEQSTIARMRALRDAGTTLMDIAHQLTVDGVATKAGARWHASTVRAILNNSLHAA